MMSVRDGADTLPATLESLCVQSYPQWWEVWVVDHRSIDGTAAVAAQFSDRLPRVTVVRDEESEYKAGAVNGGARCTKGEALLFLDADDLAATDYLLHMGRALARAPFVGGRLDVDLLNDERVRSRRSPLQNERIDVMRGHLPAVSGAAMGIWRSVFDEVGGFDDRQGQLEDVELSWRLHDAGYRAQFAPEAVVHYRYRAGIRETFRQERKYGEAEVQLYLTHREHGMKRRTLPRVVYSYLRLIALLLAVPRTGGAARFVTHLGGSVGRLIGSVRHRVFYL
nr:glycosyltransferase [Pseudonocardia nigra]